MYAYNGLESEYLSSYELNLEVILPSLESSFRVWRWCWTRSDVRARASRHDTSDVRHTRTIISLENSVTRSSSIILRSVAITSLNESRWMGRPIITPV